MHYEKSHEIILSVVSFIRLSNQKFNSYSNFRQIIEGPNGNRSENFPKQIKRLQQKLTSLWHEF